mmetsp:Transcript_74466/g.129242  ORF Transcript_74466/g.129242 Transcript_74466/m.129242 type:complete len:187 (-) Transcript_74466:166-726(-)
MGDEIPPEYVARGSAEAALRALRIACALACRRGVGERLACNRGVIRETDSALPLDEADSGCCWPLINLTGLPERGIDEGDSGCWPLINRTGLPVRGIEAPRSWRLAAGEAARLLGGSSFRTSNCENWRSYELDATRAEFLTIGDAGALSILVTMRFASCSRVEGENVGGTEFDDKAGSVITICSLF